MEPGEGAGAGVVVGHRCRFSAPCLPLLVLTVHENFPDSTLTPPRSSPCPLQCLELVRVFRVGQGLGTAMRTGSPMRSPTR